MVLQKLINKIIKNKIKASFEKALYQGKINYNKDLLHCAKHDVNYLYLLYKKLYSEYNKISLYENDNTCYTSINSHIVHNPDCKYIKAISKKNLIDVNRTNIFYGAEICKCCSKNKNFKKIQWVNSNSFNSKPSFNDEYIFNLCKDFGLKCHTSYGVIFIKTNVSTWRIYHNYEKIIDVFHENYRQNKEEYNKKRKKCNEGFHKQNINKDTLYNVLRYIESHDKYFVARIAKRKSKIDMIFQKIESEKEKFNKYK